MPDVKPFTDEQYQNAIRRHNEHHELTDTECLLCSPLDTIAALKALCHKAAKKLEANAEGRDCMNAQDMAELINKLEGA